MRSFFTYRPNISFRDNEHKNKSKELSHFIYFLKQFPKNEIWRFFVERDKYRHDRELLRSCHFSLYGTNDEDEFVMEEKLKERTIQELYDVNIHDPVILKNYRQLNWDNKKKFNIFDVIKNYKAWLGFEQNEPEYLKHVINGFCTCLDAITDNKDLSLDFIKSLHKKCTEKVKNINASPGKLREKEIRWGVTGFDTKDGIKENMQLMQNAKNKYGEHGIYFKTYSINEWINVIDLDDYEEKSDTGNEKDDIETDNKKNLDDAWNDFSNELSKNRYVYYCAINKNKETLEKICNDLIENLNKSLSEPHTEDEKLKIIFTFMKEFVLHHPFNDGVGRTLSMILTQYLLMKENLLPFIIHNSNIIPGHSVEQLIDEYKRGKKEMEEILGNPNYFDKTNSTDEKTIQLFEIQTSKLLQESDKNEKKYFLNCIKIYEKQKNKLLEKLNTFSIDEQNETSNDSKFTTKKNNK